MLIHTSILDLKSREVDLKIWLYYLPLIIFLYFDIKYIYLPLYLYSLTTSSILLILLYKMSMLGGADIFASIILSLSNASIISLIPSRLVRIGIEPILILLYTSLSILVYSGINFVRNFKDVKGLSVTQKMLLALVGKKIKIKDFLNSKFLFPLTTIKENGSVELRFNFNIEEDDKEWREYYKRLLEKRIIKEDDIIWVTWGVPVLPFMLLGYLLTLILGFPII